MTKFFLVVFICIPLLAQTQQTEPALLKAVNHPHSKGQLQSALLNLEIFYQRQHEWAKQADVLKRIVEYWSTEVGPESLGAAHYAVELGSALQNAGDMEAAENCFRSAIAVFDQNGPFYQGASDYAKVQLSALLRTESKLEEARQLSASLPKPPEHVRVDHHADLVSKQEPEYSEAARQHFLSGAIRLSFTVDETGKPADIKVVLPLGFGLDEKAVQAVTKWKFAPAILNGQAVASRVTAEVSFRLL